jgi:hypothetical protein
LKNNINSDFEPHFGVLPYRSNQTMHMEGDSSKYIEEFGSFEITPLETGINKIIQYYKILNETI